MLTSTSPLTPTTALSNPPAPTIDPATIQSIVEAISGDTTTVIMNAPKLVDHLKTFLKHKGTSEAYKPLQEAQYWNQWHQAFVAIATSQGLDDGLDPTFALGTMATSADFDLWNAKQKHAYAILSSCLIESGSQQIVQRYSNKDDLTTFGHAQHLYRDLVAHFPDGVAASTLLDTLEQEISGLCWDRKWNRTLEAFLVRILQSSLEEADRRGSLGKYVLKLKF